MAPPAESGGPPAGSPPAPRGFGRFSSPAPAEGTTPPAAIRAAIARHHSVTGMTSAEPSPVAARRNTVAVGGGAPPRSPSEATHDGGEKSGSAGNNESSSVGVQTGQEQARSQPGSNPTGLATPARGRASTFSRLALGAGYGWGATPVSTPWGLGSRGLGFSTPGSGERSVGAGREVPTVFSDVTPSDLVKRGLASETPLGSYAFSPSRFNRTEPRNFAPRVGISPSAMRPILFSAGKNEEGASTSKAGNKEVDDLDPFVSPPRPGRNNNDHQGFSRALVLSSVPEEQLSPMPWVTPATISARVPPTICALRSAHLNRLTNTPSGVPTEEEAMAPQNFPFIESAAQGGPVTHGVVQIKNIPFGTNRAEIIAFLGRNSKILNDVQEPVHIIMERVSSKTQDAFVEFMTVNDAIRTVEKHVEATNKGRITRLGERPVELVLSSQAALLETLFPLAAGVQWTNGRPKIMSPVEGEPWKTFKGFVTEEELTMLVKHVEVPSRDCPQRPYECMISTIKKFPWYMANHITLRQRHVIYNTTIKLIELLKIAIQRDAKIQQYATVLNRQLLKRLVTAGMLCPGFSVVQKDNIAIAGEMELERTYAFNQPRHPQEWVHLHALCPRPGIPVDVLEWYIAVLREETAKLFYRVPLPEAERADIEQRGEQTSQYFGYLWHEIDKPIGGKELENMTLGDMARRELAAIERVIRRAFPSARTIMGPDAHRHGYHHGHHYGQHQQY
ncbi:hypothetical protein VTJ49DRAFT_4124 [Mycothermus thermophilus]|uniref:RRM domain-containing protein n=1 Tax=Humicola insolens TaxID=85995 RepID=A0ABR3VLY4_HUMIN